MQPAAKIKKSFAMPDRLLYNRLKAIGFDLYPVEDSVNKYFLFSRYFFAQRFGGSPVDTFPQPSAKMLKNQGIDDLGFFNLSYSDFVHSSGPHPTSCVVIIHKRGGGAIRSK